MKKSIAMLLAAGLMTLGLVWAEDTSSPDAPKVEAKVEAKEEAKVDAKVEALLAKLKAEVEAAKAKIKDGATDDEKKVAEERHANVQKLVTEKLLAYCTNPVFVKETETQNAKKTTLDEIKKIDEAWIKAEEELPIQKEKMTNVCAKEITRLAKEQKGIGETFVMDNQGANVGQNALTSDYWQGDEEKWTNSFKGGKGGVDIADPKLDKSANVVEQKISLPIIDSTGNVIGAVCWGIRVDLL